MAKISVHIECEPEDFGDVLEKLVASVLRSRSDVTPNSDVTTHGGGETLPLFSYDEANGIRPVNETASTFESASSRLEENTTSGGIGKDVSTEKKKRVRRTNQQIAEDNAREAAIAAAREAALKEGAPSVQEQKGVEADANLAETQGVKDITSSLFSIGAPEPTAPPKSDPVAPTEDGALEATYEEVQKLVVELGTQHKIPFPKISEIVSKHSSAAGVASARELNAKQRGAVVAELRGLFPA